MLVGSYDSMLITLIYYNELAGPCRVRRKVLSGIVVVS